jgi:hypothetical protein
VLLSRLPRPRLHSLGGGVGGVVVVVVVFVVAGVHVRPDAVAAAADKDEAKKSF